MGLDQVVQEVNAGAARKAKELLAAATAEADAILAEARNQVKTYEAERVAQAKRDAEQLQRQALSNAKFEARKTALAAEGELRSELQQVIIAGFAGLDKKTRDAHIKKLLKRAEGVIPSGRIWGAAADAATLKKSSYTFAGETNIAGGLIVESDDGTERLDLSYEVLLQDNWREVLRSEAGLFA